MQQQNVTRLYFPYFNLFANAPRLGRACVHVRTKSSRPKGQAGRQNATDRASPLDCPALRTAQGITYLTNLSTVRRCDCSKTTCLYHTTSRQWCHANLETSHDNAERPPSGSLKPPCSLFSVLVCDPAPVPCASLLRTTLLTAEGRICTEMVAVSP